MSDCKVLQDVFALCECEKCAAAVADERSGDRLWLRFRDRQEPSVSWPDLFAQLKRYAVAVSDEVAGLRSSLEGFKEAHEVARGNAIEESRRACAIQREAEALRGELERCRKIAMAATETKDEIIRQFDDQERNLRAWQDRAMNLEREVEGARLEVDRSRKAVAAAREEAEAAQEARRQVLGELMEERRRLRGVASGRLSPVPRDQPADLAAEEAERASRDKARSKALAELDDVMITLRHIAEGWEERAKEEEAKR